MLCFETYSQGVVGVGSTAAELEERVQSGGPQAEEAMSHRCLCKKYTPAEGEAQGF